MRRGRAPERLEEGWLRPHQEYADHQHQHDVEQERDAIDPRRRHVVIGQERHLHVEQQDHRQDDDRQPRHDVEEAAHHGAALWARDRLHEEEVVQFEAQRMRAPVDSSPTADGVIELERLAGEQHELRQDAEVEQHQHDRARTGRTA